MTTDRITTAEELNALPVGSVVVEGDHTTPDAWHNINIIPGVFHRFPDGCWYVIAGHGPCEVPLPATLLHRPDRPTDLAALGKAKAEALREARRVISQYLATAEKWRYDRVLWAFAVMLGEIPEDAPEPGPPDDRADQIDPDRGER